jgi:hypothetical protein
MNDILALGFSPVKLPKIRARKRSASWEAFSAVDKRLAEGSREREEKILLSGSEMSHQKWGKSQVCH